MNTAGLWELVTGVIIIAVIYMLVRPGSPAHTAINTLSAALATLVTTATAYNPSATGTQSTT